MKNINKDAKNVHFKVRVVLDEHTQKEVILPLKKDDYETWGVAERQIGNILSEGMLPIYDHFDQLDVVYPVSMIKKFEIVPVIIEDEEEETEEE